MTNANAAELMKACDEVLDEKQPVLSAVCHARTIARALKDILAGAAPVHPTAAYECGTCSAQWYDGIQSDCGHAKNERSYFRPSPCIAFLKEPAPDPTTPANEISRTDPLDRFEPDSLSEQHEQSHAGEYSTSKTAQGQDKPSPSSLSAATEAKYDARTEAERAQFIRTVNEALTREATTPAQVPGDIAEALEQAHKALQQAYTSPRLRSLDPPTRTMLQSASWRIAEALKDIRTRSEPPTPQGMVTKERLKAFYSEWCSHEDGEDTEFADALLAFMGELPKFDPDIPGATTRTPLNDKQLNYIAEDPTIHCTTEWHWRLWSTIVALRARVGDGK